MRLQAIEIALRSAYLRGVVAMRAVPRPPQLPDWNVGTHRVLLLRDDGLGDMIVSLAIAKAIVNVSPNIQLDVLASPANAMIAERSGIFREVLSHKRGSLKRSRATRRMLSTRGYDTVIDGRVAIGNVNTQTTLLLLSTRAPYRVGIGGRRNDGVYSVPVIPARTEHWIDLLATLATPFGIDATAGDWTPVLAVSDEERDAALARWRAMDGGTPRVLLNISVGHPERRWPDDRYGAVLARLRARAPHAAIAVLAMPSDRASAMQLAASVNGQAWSLDIPQSIAACATADLVITPDTAVSHMASAFRTPTLTLLRQGYERWVPYRTPGRNVFGDDPRRLIGLPTARVNAALDDLLDEFAGSRAWNLSTS
jgi:ADP-heptose:LPS heptosyltransferase